MNSRVWFVTGCSTGFGKVLCEKLLDQGERVVATARKLESISHLATKVNSKASENQLLLLALDVTDRKQIDASVARAIQHFGRIDVLVNNAGYGTMGALEEVPEPEIRAIFETNVFGLMAMTRAVLPTMRSQKSGHILNLSSVAGMVALPGAGVYAATKFAVEGHSEALAGEVGPLGIKVTLIEPGAFRTDFANRSIHIAPYRSEYDESLKQARHYYETIGGTQPGDPAKAVDAMIAVVNHPAPPLRLVLGKIALARVHAKIGQYQNEMKQWESTTLNCDF